MKNDDLHPEHRVHSSLNNSWSVITATFEKISVLLQMKLFHKLLLHRFHLIFNFAARKFNYMFQALQHFSLVAYECV